MTDIREVIDTTALGWVKPELDETLRQARQEIEDFVEMAGDPSRMATCVALLHQVHGTLQMIELAAPALVAEEMERLAEAVQQGGVPEQEEACAALMRGVVQLPDYLERLQGGHRDVPIVLLPLLNELRAARGEPALSESSLLASGLGKTFQLDEPAPTDAERKHAESSLTGRNRALLDTVSAALKEDLLRVKDTLDLHLRTGRVDVNELKPQVNALAQVGETLGMIGLTTARNVVLQQRDAMADIVSGARAADETALLDIAGALLYVDATLDEQVDSLGSEDTGNGAQIDAVASESRKVLDFVVREAIANFSDARQAFVAFVETGWDHAELTEVPRLLDEVAGALRIIEMQQPADYLVAIARFAEVELISHRRVLQGVQLDKLADALASFEYFLEALRDQRPNREGILDIARTSLESLGYWPLPSAEALAAASEVSRPVAEVSTPAIFPPTLAPVVEASAAAPIAPAPVVAPSGSAPAAPVVESPAPTSVSAGFEHNADIDDDIREIFLEELQEEIDNLGELMPNWRARPDEPDVLRPIRRVFHTLKGSGRLVGARTLGEFSWKIESMLNRVLDGTRPASPAVIALVAHAHAALPQLHAALANNMPVTADLAGIEAIADRVAAGEEVHYVAPTVAALADGVALEMATSSTPVSEGAADANAPASVDAVLLEILGTEVTGHLVIIDTWLEAAKVSPQLADDRLQRAIHTLNGAFAMTEVPVITEFTGPTETYIKRLLATGALPSAEGVAAIGAVATAIRQTLESLQAERQSVPLFTGLAERVSALRDSLPDTRSLPPEAYELEDSGMIAINLSEFMPKEGVVEQLKAGRLQAERLEAERLQAERIEADRLEAEGLKADRIEADRLEAERLEADRLEAERLEAERLEADRLEADRLEAERLETERLETARLESERVEAERLEAEQLEAARVAVEEAAEHARLEADYAHAAERLRLREAEQVEAELLETERLAAEARAIAERDALAAPISLEEDRTEYERLSAEYAILAASITAEDLDAIAVDRHDYERLSSEYAEGAANIALDDLDAADVDIEVASDASVALRSPEDERSEYERLTSEYAALAASITVDDLDKVEIERSEYERLTDEYASHAASIALDELDTLDLEDEPQPEVIAEEVAELKADAASDELTIEYERLMAEYAAEAGDIGSPSLDSSQDAARLIPAIQSDDEELRFEDDVDAPADEEALATVVSEAPVGTPSILSLIEIEADPDEALDLTGLDPELVDIFVEEGGDLLDHSDGLLAKLREAPSERDPLVGLQRDLHTLKGGARMAGIMPIGELGHVMESLLEAVVEKRTDLGADGLPLLERGFDRLHAMVTRVGDRQAVSMPVSLIAIFEARSRGQAYVPAPVERAPAAVDVVSSGTTPTLPSTSTPSTSVAPPRPLPELKPLKPLSAPLSDAPLDDDEIGVRAPQEQVRIRADLLDRLVNYAGEVAIYRARLEQQLGAFRGAIAEMEATNLRMRDQLRRLEIETEAQIIARYQREETTDTTFDPLELDRFSNLQQLSRALSESAADQGSLQVTLDDLTRQYETLLLQQSRVSSELQEGLMRTRMVPFDGLLPRLRRVVRQASGETGKQVALKLEGTQGELDRNVLERMTAPLEHMLRNAIAHGLETPDIRKAGGKPEEGTVRIAVRREGSEVVLEVADDGRGLDREAIRRRGLERGLIRADTPIGDADLDLLIFEPGFSTVDEVSRLAGRGVGMDVVASEVRQLGGTLDIQSTAQLGTTFTLRLPQTLAVTQAVFVRVGETSFAVPIASVRGVGRLPREALIDAAIADRDAVYRYGGEDYVVHDLGSLLGQSPVKAEGALQVPVLLIRSGDLRAAVLVDQVVGNREIVVKPLGPQVASIPGIFGATIMGDGRVVVILDVAPLVRRQVALPRGEFIALAPVIEKRVVPLVMVVDDSVTMRKVTGRVLERHNFEVTTAKDGIDALERMVDRVPDLMLLDIEMPRMDGYELATAMKADPRLRDVPIVMITSRTGDKHRERAFQIGVNRYLGKPYQEPELMRNVYDLLRIARQHE